MRNADIHNIRESHSDLIPILVRVSDYEARLFLGINGNH